ncbi:6-phosphogluconolactonase [Neomegalonema sp.]|uniref:6-phosphogluconolactonase n=1 Tax=Neomegalonema sp. TaxID=2039713 RepID=UPI00261D3B8C|nr:6-phosphogluconolactonase [Neomegalonema sp.]MDD2869512.1 6-phosphogluconolactonase [Neomegalonema sp.]
MSGVISKVEIRAFAGREAQALALAAAAAADLAEAIRLRGRASLAVPGGTTPGPFLVELSRADLDWAKLSVTLTDERWVPEESERSNGRLLRATLLRGPASAARFIPLFTGAPTPEEAFGDLDDALRPLTPLDVCVLGMGTDGHTASLFPGGDRLAEAMDPAQPLAALALRAPGAPEPRLTLTRPVLTGARRACLLINGAEKRRVLAEALDPAGAEADMPVRAILRAAGGLTVFDAP